MSNELKTTQKEAMTIIAAGVATASEMKSTVAVAQGFGFSVGPWKGVGSSPESIRRSKP